MVGFEFYIKESQQTIRKIVIKNKSNTTKLFKLTYYKEIVRLLVVKGHTSKEVQVDGKDAGFSVKEVTD